MNGIIFTVYIMYHGWYLMDSLKCTTITIFHCSWVGLVSKNYEIERACVELEKEVTTLDQKKAKVKTRVILSLFSNFTFEKS
jgi:hypothetical protein